MLYIPESPKFLYSVKKFDEARQVIKYMALINGFTINEENFNFVYDTEITKPTPELNNKSIKDLTLATVKTETYGSFENERYV